jgi:hypothetical protein
MTQNVLKFKKVKKEPKKQTFLIYFKKKNYCKTKNGKKKKIREKQQQK